MLHNSITVRLNNITEEAFLSPLYSLFVSSLATAIPTPEENIFIMNVQDDTDVSAKILNVSFSVRQKLDNNKDVFYSPQFLRERVYLQRTLLAKLSTLEVSKFWICIFITFFKSLIINMWYLIVIDQSVCKYLRQT